jgi:3-hydroxyisobutyrate dehydrogenase
VSGGDGEFDDPAGDESVGVGFIGLGNIGGPMAKRLRDWPGGLTVLDVRPEAMERLVAKGARAATTPADVAAHAQVISVMVLDDAQVREVVAGPDGIFGAARPGTVVAIHSTIAPETAVELATQGEGLSVAVVDAPVSGGAMGAAGGNLAAMVGGTTEAVDACREPFARWAGLVAHLGPVGAGTRAKLARNLLHFVSFTAVGEALRLAEAAGVDLAQLGAVVRHSDAVTGGPGAIMLRDVTGPLADDDGLRAIFAHTRDLGEKDLRHALALGAELGVDLPLAALALPRLADALGVPHDEPVSNPPAQERP